MQRPLICRTLRFDVRKAIKRYDALLTGGESGLFTGINYLDNVSGGLKPGNYVLIGAPTGTGKTTFALNIVNHVALVNMKTVAFFSFEMSRQQIIDMLFSLNFGVDRNHFNTGKFTKEEMDLIAFRYQEIARCPLRILDDSLAGVDDITKDCQIIMDDVELSLIVVDYVQLVRPYGYRDSREQQVANISRALKALAGRCKCPVLVLSQLNEEGRVRESRALIHDADIALMLSEAKESTDTITVEIQKGRSIPKGKFNLRFDAGLCKFIQPV
jgi:replicative DNA helicase